VKVESIIFNIIAIFCVGAAVVYGVWAKEPVGTTALVLSAGLTGMIGAFFWFVSRRIDARPEDRKDAEIADGSGELGFFSPGSYWPFTLAVGAGITGVRIERVSEADDLVRDMRRCRLPSREQRRDVVQRREIVRGYDGPPARAQDSANLAHEVIRTREVLDHLVRVDRVDGTVRERQSLLEAHPRYLDALRGGRIRMVLHHLDSEQAA
jgi:hypothetical protein